MYFEFDEVLNNYVLGGRVRNWFGFAAEGKDSREKLTSIFFCF
jgi:hypothetical protein